MSRNELKVSKAAALMTEQTGILDVTMTKHFWTDEKGRVKALPRYDDPEVLAKKIDEWEVEMTARISQGEEIIPNAEAMCAYLGISSATMKAWRRGEMGDAHRNIIEVELNRIAAVINQLAMKGAIPPIVWATTMNNTHGYTQAKNVEIEVSQKRTPESAEVLIKSAKLLP